MKSRLKTSRFISVFLNMDRQKVDQQAHTRQKTSPGRKHGVNHASFGNPARQSVDKGSIAQVILNNHTGKLRDADAVYGGIA